MFARILASRRWKRRASPGWVCRLISKSQVIGVLALEKWQAYFYTREHVQVGTTFASQAAVALGECTTCSKRA